MAVEAHHLIHSTGGGGAGGQRQLLAHAGWAWAGDAASCYEAPAAQQQGRWSPCYGREAVAAAGRPTGQQGFRQRSCVATPAPSSAAAAGQLVTPGQYAAGLAQMCAADASESGLTFGGGGGVQQEAMMAMEPRKRKRAEHGQAPVLGLATADMAANFQQQLVDVDRLVLQHTTKMLAELGERRRRHAGQLAAAAEAAVVKRLRLKNEEIERMGRLNWALEERVKSLYLEAQVWRDLAQSNEAAANALRGELQQALDAQQARLRVIAGADAGTDSANDADSCCCGENDVAAAGAEDEAGTSSGARRRMCTVCGEGVADVLLLPCRHLCACSPCAGAARACPACGCDKNGSVCINFS